MNIESLAARAANYLDYLCLDLPSRRVGSPGNRQAVDWFARQMAGFGFRVETPPFDCIDWNEQGADLIVGGERFDAQVGPFSPGCRAQTPLAVVSTLAELEAVEASGKVLLLRGELAKEQLMPKGYPFYNPEEHQRILSLLESKAPLAIVTAGARCPEIAGAVYPVPLIEDGNFHIPSVNLTEEEGLRLADFAGQPASLEIRAQRSPATGSNVLASLGGERRVVLTAHIDAKQGTPGALDDGSGIVTLLLLGELLNPLSGVLREGYPGALGVELVAINGEDHYSAAGELSYLERNQGKMDHILLNINLDAVGFYHGSTVFSLYECPDELAGVIRARLTANGIPEGQPWYQGDHMVFAMNGVPAVAVASDAFGEILEKIAHTPRDLPDVVDCRKLAAVALALFDLVQRLDQDTGRRHP
jgi:aminopeptidase YwaD